MYFGQNEPIQKYVNTMPKHAIQHFPAHLKNMPHLAQNKKNEHKSSQVIP